MDCAPAEVQSPMSPAPTSVPDNPVEDAAAINAVGVGAGAGVDTAAGEGAAGADRCPHDEHTAVATRILARVVVLWNIEPAHTRNEADTLPQGARKQSIEISSRVTSLTSLLVCQQLYMTHRWTPYRFVAT